MENIDRQKKKLRIGLMFDCDVGGQLHRHSTRSELMSCRRNEDEKAENRTFILTKLANQHEMKKLANQLEMKKVDRDIEETKLKNEIQRNEKIKLEIEKEQCKNPNLLKSMTDFQEAKANAEKAKANAEEKRAAAETARANAEEKRAAAETAKKKAQDAESEKIKRWMEMNKGSAELPGIMHAHDAPPANIMSSFS